MTPPGRDYMGRTMRVVALRRSPIRRLAANRDATKSVPAVAHRLVVACMSAARIGSVNKPMPLDPASRASGTPQQRRRSNGHAVAEQIHSSTREEAAGAGKRQIAKRNEPGPGPQRRTRLHRHIQHVLPRSRYSHRRDAPQPPSSTHPADGRVPALTPAAAGIEPPPARTTRHFRERRNHGSRIAVCVPRHQPPPMLPYFLQQRLSGSVPDP